MLLQLERSCLRLQVSMSVSGAAPRPGAAARRRQCVVAHLDLDAFYAQRKKA